MKTKIKMPVAPEAEFAKFASVARVTHSAFEFYLDFGQFLPENKGFKTHTGRYHAPDATGVPHPDSVDHHHFFPVQLALHLTVHEGRMTTVEIEVDVNQWYQGPNEIDLVQHVAPIMANTAMQDLLEENGTGWKVCEDCELGLFNLREVIEPEDGGGGHG